MWISWALGVLGNTKASIYFFIHLNSHMGSRKDLNYFSVPADTFRYPKFSSKRLYIPKYLLCLHVFTLPRILVPFRCYRLDTIFADTVINLQATVFLKSKTLCVVSKQMKRGVICFDSETVKIIPYFLKFFSK